MLTSKSDYRYVNVDDVTISGDIIPAREKRGLTKHSLRLEDMAFIREALRERFEFSPRLNYSGQRDSLSNKLGDGYSLILKAHELLMGANRGEVTTPWLSRSYRYSEQMPIPSPFYIPNNRTVDFGFKEAHNVSDFIKGSFPRLKVEDSNLNKVIKLDEIRRVYADLAEFNDYAFEPRSAWIPDGEFPYDIVDCSGTATLTEDGATYIERFSNVPMNRLLSFNSYPGDVHPAFRTGAGWSRTRAPFTGKLREIAVEPTRIYLKLGIRPTNKIWTLVMYRAEVSYSDGRYRNGFFSRLEDITARELYFYTGSYDIFFSPARIKKELLEDYLGMGDNDTGAVWVYAIDGALVNVKNNMSGQWIRPKAEVESLGWKY